VKKRLIPAFIIASSLSFSANATEDSGWFAGAAVGKVDSDIPIRSHQKAVASKVLAGYHFNKYFAAGVEYIDFQKYEGISSDENLTLKLNNTAWNVFALFSYPVSDTFDVFAKAGSLQWDAEFKFNIKSPAQTVSIDEDGNNVSWGVGAAWDASPTTALTLEFQHMEFEHKSPVLKAFDMENIDYDIVTLGFTYRF